MSEQKENLEENERNILEYNLMISIKFLNIRTLALFLLEKEGLLIYNKSFKYSLHNYTSSKILQQTVKHNDQLIWHVYNIVSSEIPVKIMKFVMALRIF